MFSCYPGTRITGWILWILRLRETYHLPRSSCAVLVVMYQSPYAWDRPTPRTLHRSVGEARKEEACRNIGEQVFADLVATLGPYRHDLTSPANMASRQRLIGILDDRGRDGWALAELVECLTTNVVGVGSVMAVVLSRAKALTPPPSAAHLEEAEQRLEEERGARKIAGARTYGRNRVGVLSAAELEEDLVHRFEDPCLIEAARDAFNEHALKLHSAAPNVQESNNRLFDSSHSSQRDSANDASLWRFGA
jgi:hypothetical protein